MYSVGQVGRLKRPVFIYEVKHRQTGYRYIGQSYEPWWRFYQHMTAPKNDILARLLLESGKDAFSLHVFDHPHWTTHGANFAERAHVWTVKCLGYPIMNKTAGGERVFPDKDISLPWSTSAAFTMRGDRIRLT